MAEPARSRVTRLEDALRERFPKLQVGRLSKTQAIDVLLDLVEEIAGSLQQITRERETADDLLTCHRQAWQRLRQAVERIVPGFVPLPGEHAAQHAIRALERLSSLPGDTGGEWFASEREAIAEARIRFEEHGYAITVWRLPAGRVDGVSAPERFVIRRGIGPEDAPSDGAVLVHGLSRRNPA